LTFNRYIAVSLLSHILFLAFLGLTSFNGDHVSRVFDVDIVGPLETEKPPPVKMPQPSVAPPKPRVRETIKKPFFNEKAKPDTLYGENSGSTPKGKEDVTPSKNRAQPENEGILPPGKEGEETLPAERKTPSVAPPTALFDRKIIEKFALKEPSPEKGLTFESEFKHRGYMKMLKEKIESIWQYPKEAARLGLSGDLYIKFTIMRNGKLGEVELVRTSGYKELDEAAMKALKDAEPYWPLPADWKKDTLEITGHFIYVYGSSYVM
jgi:protein TonB